MRTSNPYHKYEFLAQFRDKDSKDGLLYKDEFIPFRGNYPEINTFTNTYLLKGLSISAEKAVVITRENTGLQINDRIWNNGSPGIITEIQLLRINNIGGDRFDINNKDYVYVLEN